MGSTIQPILAAHLEGLVGLYEALFFKPYLSKYLPFGSAWIYTEVLKVPTYPTSHFLNGGYWSGEGTFGGVTLWFPWFFWSLSGPSNSAETSPSREDSDDRVRNHYILVASRSDAKLLELICACLAEAICNYLLNIHTWRSRFFICYCNWASAGFLGVAGWHWPKLLTQLVSKAWPQWFHMIPHPNVDENGWESVAHLLFRKCGQ